MSTLLIAIIVILLPGIIAATISDHLTTHRKWTTFKFGLYSILLGIFTYASLQILLYIFDIIKAISISPITWNHLHIWTCALNGGSGIKAWEVCFAAFFSLPVAFMASWTINFKLFNKIAQKIHISQKYGDENLYSYYLNAKEIDWVYVRDIKNKLTYEGRVVSYSENEMIQEIVLSEVGVYRYEDSELLYNIPTIYLSQKLGEFRIEAIPYEFEGDQNE